MKHIMEGKLVDLKLHQDGDEYWLSAAFLVQKGDNVIKHIYPKIMLPICNNRIAVDIKDRSECESMYNDPRPFSSIYNQQKIIDLGFGELLLGKIQPVNELTLNLNYIKNDLETFNKKEEKHSEDCEYYEEEYSDAEEGWH